MRQVAVTEGDKVEAQLRLGISVNGYGVGELVDAVRGVADAAVDGLVDEYLPIFDSKTDLAFLEIGRKVMENHTGQMFAKGIVSGWMIATMVWMIPSMESAKMGIIILITYLMALGDFTHIVVGSAEVSYLVFAGELPWKDFGWCSPGRRWREISSVAALSLH